MASYVYLENKTTFSLFILIFFLNQQLWFGCNLKHINHCWLFFTKSCFYEYIEYMISKHIL